MCLQGASYSAGVEIASLEQGVEDPGSMTNDEWDDYISIVRARREAAASADPSFSGTHIHPHHYRQQRQICCVTIIYNSLEGITINSRG